MEYAQIRARFAPLKRKLVYKFRTFASADEIEQLCDIGAWEGIKAARKKGCEDVKFVANAMRWYVHTAFRRARPETLLPEPKQAPMEDRAVFHASVQQIAKNLPPVSRQILHLLSLGHNQTQVAHLIGKNHATVRKHLTNHIRPAFEEAGWGIEKSA